MDDLTFIYRDLRLLQGISIEAVHDSHSKMRHIEAQLMLLCHS
jgi:hypothetical protein